MGRYAPISAFESETFGQDVSFRLEQPIGAMSISPSGRDVVLASKEGLHVIDLDSPYSPPRYLPHRTPWEVADVQWSPHAVKDSWVASTSNQKALVWNLALQGWQGSTRDPSQIPSSYPLHQTEGLPCRPRLDRSNHLSIFFLENRPSLSTFRASSRCSDLGEHSGDTKFTLSIDVSD